MKQRLIRLRQVVAAIVAGTALTLSASVHAQADADFTTAKTAFERGDWRRLDAIAPALAGHVLERYVQYWQNATCSIGS
jgi:hypothetical protein